MKIQESAENYLETIFMLKKDRGFVRSIDIAHELGFSKASVSVAMKSLREAGYAVVDEDGGISLTEKGLEVANRMYERHEVIANVLISLGVDSEIAYEDSCKIEHVISDTTFEKIKEYIEKVSAKD
ncbi:MAG: metal-dependent transcriptional regulator [Clostridia bacterium]|nr:metal-dependent transcriptional regulator [Clostridia bacterium]